MRERRAVVRRVARKRALKFLNHQGSQTPWPEDCDRIAPGKEMTDELKVASGRESNNDRSVRSIIQDLRRVKQKPPRVRGC